MEVVNFNDYREVTMNGFKEMIQLNEETRRNIEDYCRNENKILSTNLKGEMSKLNGKLNKQQEQLKEQGSLLMKDKDLVEGGGDGQPGLNAALISGPLEVKIFTLET